MDKQKLESVQINKVVETSLYTAFPPKATTPGGKAGCVLTGAPKLIVHRLKFSWVSGESPKSGGISLWIGGRYCGSPTEGYMDTAAFLSLLVMDSSKASSLMS